MNRCNRSARSGVAAALIAAALCGCASSTYRVPDAALPPLQREPALIETGSRIPRGKEQPVRDGAQNVDVYSEEELEADRPVDTRDAVRRAINGR
jgi:hypothetical protein